MADTKISALTAGTALTDDDLLVFVDAPGGTPATKKITALNAKSYFGGSGGGVPWLVSGLVAGDTDTNAAANITTLQAALDAAEGTTGLRRVVCPAGTYRFGDTANVGSRTVYAGQGWGTVHKLANGVATAATPKAVVKAKNGTNYVGVEDIFLDGNKAGQTDTTYSSPGVDFSRGTTEGSGAPVYDGGMWCRNVMVYGCQGAGFAVYGGATTMRVLGCYAYHNDDAGFYGKTDCIFADCVAGNNGGYGFRWYAGTSIIGTGLKAFGNCQRYQGSDFLVGYCNTVLLANCQAEDSCEAGFTFTATSHLTVVGCQAYRHATNANADGGRTGFWVEDDGAGNLCHHVKIVGDVYGGGSAGTPWALTTRNLGASVEIRLNVESVTSGNWNHLSGSLSDSIVEFGNVPKVPVSLIDAKGDLFAGTADNTVARLPVGTNNYVLTADSTQAAGVKWAAAAAGSSLYFNVKDYGALGNDSNDDTTAINNCVSAATTAKAGVWFPAGTYKITSALNWKITGLVVKGAGKWNTKIRQYTANTPVVQVAGGSQDISGLTLTYQTQQTSAQTNGICLTFGDDTVGSCFDSHFRDLLLSYGNTGMAINPAITTVAGMFSCLVEDVRVFAYSYSAINLVGSNNLGANCTGCVFSNIYTHNNPVDDSTTCAYYPIFLQNWDEITFHQLNVEHGTCPSFDLMGIVYCGSVLFDGLHFEAYTLSANNKAMIYTHDAKIVINAGTCRFNTFSGATSNPIFRFTGTPSNSRVMINGWTDSSNTRTTPSRVVLAYGTATGVKAIINGMDTGQTTALTSGGDTTDKSLFDAGL